VTVRDDRWAAAREYVGRLAAAHDFLWERAYGEYRGGRLSLPTAMLLLHPMWLPHEVSQTTAQGPSTFPTAAPFPDPCMGHLLWGYACPFDSPAIHGDHVWPYWAGGPTVGPNRLSLCERHNSMKSGDVHLYPWELGEPHWLRTQLDRIGDLRRSALGPPP
jgi:hypothetical protein